MLSFHESLAKYYIKWFQDACDSVVYCREVLKNEARAADYIHEASQFLTIIMENYEEISSVSK